MKLNWRISPNALMVIVGAVCFGFWMESITAGIFAGCFLTVIDPKGGREWTKKKDTE